jgi:hypothetical protein
MNPAPDSGWARLAGAVAEVFPAAEVDAIWTFRPLRHEGKEWGTAVLSRVDGDRRRIYTARYVLAIKGKERGKFEASVQEVGSGPATALAQLLRDAQKRIDDEEPPTPVSPASWFPDGAAAGAADGSAR